MYGDKRSCFPARCVWEAVCSTSVEYRENHYLPSCFFFAALLKYPEKSNVREEGFILTCGTQDTVHCGGGRRSSRSIRQWVTLHLHISIRSHCSHNQEAKSEDGRCSVSMLHFPFY